MDTVKQSLLLLKTLYRHNRGLTGLKKKGDKKSAKAGKIAGIIVLVLVFGVMFAVQAFLTGLTVAQEVPEKLSDYLSVFFFIAQMGILILGILSTLGTLYFSKDNVLLTTLPVGKTAIFLSKFLYCYFSELMISAAVVLVTVTAYGVGATVGGAALSAWYFVIEVLSILLVPVIPLLLIAILSIPMMYLVSFIKRSRVANLVLTVLFTVMLIGVMVVPALMNAGIGADGDHLNLSTYGALSSFTVFNKPLSDSMFLIDPAANFFIYFGAMLGGFLLVAALSMLTYPKILQSSLDGGQGNRKKKTKKAEFKKLSFRKTYLKKELKTIFSTPTLLANMVLPIILLPVFVVIFVANGMFVGEAGLGAPASEFGAAGFVMYLACLITVTSNPIAMMGFSMEGKNIFFLKTLPLSAKEMVRLKLKIADAITAVLALVLLIAFGASSQRNDFLLAAIMAVQVTGFGMAFNRFGLYNDLKKPMLNWQNIQEINNNSKRNLKPMLICIFCCIVFIIMGFLFDGMTDTALWLRYLLFAAVGLLIDMLIYILTAKKLYENANALWERIE